MQLRKLVLVCSLASFALSNFASALGLGEITLNSTLNEPLNAEVKLVDTRDLSSDQILVALASPADFERNGIDRLYFYTELQFQVVLNNPGGPVVRITTRNPVREPYLNFLLEARWTAGRLLREYTVLMDLPTFDEAVPQPVEAAQSNRSTAKESRATAPAETVQQSQPQPVTEQPPQSSIIDEPSVPYANEKSTVEEKPAVIAEQDQSAKKFEPGAGTYGPVSKKDTLWEIAKAVRPTSKTSIHQTMLALQRLNPNAFIHGNINLIKKGQVLRVPDVNEISSVPKSAAMSMVAAQNDAWANAKASMAANTTELGAQLDASSNTPRDRTQTETVSGRVKLETPLSADAGDGGQGRGAKKGTGKALESELSSTLEELDKSKFEKSELSSRVKDLEEQAKTMQKLTEASNEKLRAMQLNAAKLAEAKAAAQAAEEARLAEQKSVSSIATVTDPVPDTAIQPAAVDQAAPIVSAEASSVEASVAASSVSAPVLPEKKAARVVAEKSIIDTVLENLWVVLVAAGFIGVAVFMIRRRKFEEAMPHSRFNNDNEDLYSSEPNFDNFNEQQEQYELEAEPEQEDELGLFEEDEVSAVAETGDVVGEADIYIAYGKFDQAEEMLLNGLVKDPHSSDIRLKLLEVYSQTQNAVEFDKHYAALLPVASEFIKNRASELRSNIAGVSAFAAASTVMQSTFSASPPPSKAEEEFSFDLDDDSTVVNYDKTQIKSAPSNATTQRYSLDFDDAPVANAKGVTLDDDFSLDLDADSDFNLDLDTSKNKAELPEAEDLSEISLALDGLDDDIIDDDLEVAEVDEEFSFDFNELDTDSSNLTAKESASKASQLADGNADDFNLELDMNDIDLAALDHEMESLDADLESLDFDEVKPASRSSTAKLEQIVDDEVEIDWAEDDDLDLGTTRSSLESVNDVPATTASKTPQSSVDDEIADDVFDQALSDFSADNLNVTDADMSDADLDSELDFMADADESATKLDLARAYIDMGDNEGARDILAEVAHEGNDQQRQEAVDLLSRIDV
ncbi:MAG: FimV/HubP family polar landmark protein [Pseudomonadota bacterium]